MLANVKLSAKFTWVLVALFLGVTLSSTAILLYLFVRQAETEVNATGVALIEMVNAVRQYTSDDLVPLLEVEAERQPLFTRPIVPAFAARKVFEIFRQRDHADYIYKEAALNPLNPINKADSFETAILTAMRATTTPQESSGFRLRDGQWIYYLARPMRIQKPSCLQCHGDPAHAPAKLVAEYGATSGFGWQMHEVVATQIVYVPATTIYRMALTSLPVPLLMTMLLFALAILAANRTLRTYVVHPLNLIDALAQKISSDQLETNDLATPALQQIGERQDEIGNLMRVIQQMAQQVLVRTNNLKAQVEARTVRLAQAVEEAQAARLAAEQANAAKSLFLANVSHELRTPLTAIVGFAKLNRKKLAEQSTPAPLDPAAARKTMQLVGTNTDIIVTEGERLTQLINNVLDLVKLEAGQQSWQMAPVDPYQLLEEATAAAAPLLQKSPLYYRQEIDPDLPVVVGDQARLVQVLVNLIGNAVKFTSAGSVTCRATATAQAVQFSISDTGPGIAPVDQAQLFTTFYQPGNQLTNKPAGTGLGLAICKAIIEQHQGRIWVESAPGQGCTVAFTLPRYVPTPHQ